MESTGDVNSTGHNNNKITSWTVPPQTCFQIKKVIVRKEFLWVLSVQNLNYYSCIFFIHKPASVTFMLHKLMIAAISITLSRSSNLLPTYWYQQHPVLQPWLRQKIERQQQLRLIVPFNTPFISDPQYVRTALYTCSMNLSEKLDKHT